MSDSYQKKTDAAYRGSAVRMLDDSPDYLRDFYLSMQDKKSEMTRTSYLRDVIFFIRYLMQINPDFRKTELKDFPIEIFSTLSSSDIEEYKNMLIGKYQKKSVNNKNDDKPSVPPAARTKIAAVVCFLSFLSESVNTDIKNIIPSGALGTASKKGKATTGLTGEQIEQLIDGVRENRYFLHDDQKIRIDEKTFVKREHLVIRNIAILQLLLSTDIRLSELVSLDVDDVFLQSGKIRVGESYKDLSPDAVAALTDYLSGPVPSPAPSGFSVISEFADFAKTHVWDLEEDFDKAFRKSFPDASAEIRNEARDYMISSRRHGRNGFKTGTNNALFVTFRGTRMSTRMIELMVKESILLYVDMNMDFTPNRLRNNTSKSEP